MTRKIIENRSGTTTCVGQENKKTTKKKPFGVNFYQIFGILNEKKNILGFDLKIVGIFVLISSIIFITSDG